MRENENGEMYMIVFNEQKIYQKNRWFILINLEFILVIQELFKYMNNQVNDDLSLKNYKKDIQLL